MTEREPTPDELEGWGPPRASPGERLFGLMVAVLMTASFGGIGVLAAWVTLSSVQSGDWGAAAFTGVAALFCGGVVFLVGQGQVDEWRPRPVPTVREVTLRPVAVGFAHDADERDIIWCFVRTEDGVFVCPDDALGDLTKRLAKARLELHYLGDVLMMAKASGPAVPQLGLQDLQRDEEPTWSPTGDEPSTWTRVDLPVWMA